MKDVNLNKRRKFWAGSGFYLALAVCVAAVGGLAVWTISDSLTNAPSGDGESTLTTTSAVEVAKPVTSVRDDRPLITTTRITTTARTAVSTQKTSVNTSLFVLPLGNTVVREYSKAPVFWGTLDTWRVHFGTDFTGKVGDTVKAVADGTVKKVYSNTLWGDCLVLEHGGGRVSTYCGVTATVSEGARVTVGDAVGTLSAVPCEADLPVHLHLEMTVNGNPVDPMAVIGGEIKLVSTSTKKAETSKTN